MDSGTRFLTITSILMLALILQVVQAVADQRDIFGDLHGYTVFSRLDLWSAYHQLPVSKRTRKFLAIATVFGMYQYRRVPMGLKLSSAHLQRVLQGLLGDVSGVFIYADDILLASRTTSEHVALLELVMSRLAAVNFTLKFEKCVIGARRLPYLGRIISASGVELDPSSTLAAMALKVHSVEDVRSLYHGLQHQAKFIRNFARIVEP